MNFKFKTYVYLSLGITLLAVLLIFGLRNLLPPEVPLFYGNPVGEEQLTSTLGLLIAPGISLFIILINATLSIFVSEPFLKQALILSALFVSILMSITVLKIIFLVALW